MPADIPPDPVTLSGTRAKGRRPAYFDDPATDRLLSITLALAAELSVVRERLDTLERLLEAQNTLDRSAIETYRPDRTAGRERGEATRAYVARIMRAVQQDAEALADDTPPTEDLIARLRDL